MSVPETIVPIVAPTAGRKSGGETPVPVRCLWAWRLWCAAALAAAGLGTTAAARLLGPLGALAWAGIFLAVAGWFLVGVRRELGTNHPPRALHPEQTPDGPLRPFPTLGVATHLTLGRALATAALAASLVAPLRLALAVAVLYTLIAVGDALDGPVARAAGRISVLGAWLDVRVDSAALAAAALALVLQGRAWPVFLVVGLLRPLFLAALALRRRRGARVVPLVSSPGSRAVAGAVMGYLAVALYPLYPAPAARLAGLCFLVPLLVTYLRDWLAVTGRWSAAGRIAPLVRGATPWVRAAAGLGMVALAAGWGDLLGDLGPAGRVLVAVCGLAVLSGFLGRAAALGGLLTLGLAYQGTAQMGGPMVALGMVLAAAAFFTGPGVHALWSPEEGAIRVPGDEVQRPAAGGVTR